MVAVSAGASVVVAVVSVLAGGTVGSVVVEVSLMVIVAVSGVVEALACAGRVSTAVGVEEAVSVVEVGEASVGGGGAEVVGVEAPACAGRSACADEQTPAVEASAPSLPTLMQWGFPAGS